MVFLVYLILFIIIVCISAGLTGLIRYYSIEKNLYDIPNQRSSHEIPKPKGGGISIVLIVIGSIILLLLSKKINLDISISLLVGLTIVSITALIDDLFNLSALIRAVFYVIASFISLYLIDGLTVLSINNYSFNIGSLGLLLGVIFIVWLTNLYNFMDGTDSFAGIQTICVAIFMGSILFLSSNLYLGVVFFCLIAATVGFLYWNWPPAKIFMGDVGSCSIGFLFGLMSIYTEQKETISITVWLIALAPFISDATFTLLKRILNGEKWYKAHNTHAYQRLYQRGISHRNLAIGLLFINIVIIWPVAYITQIYKNIEFIMLILTYIIMAIIWFGVQNNSEESKLISS
jgi:glycosyltransferase WbpL